MRAELKERERIFVNEQLKRDQDLLKMLEVREMEMEQNLLYKADAFGHLYKISATIQEVIRRWKPPCTIRRSYEQKV